MSEMLVADLEWWAGKKRESVESGSQYATKDAKTLAELERWIVWRTQCPGDAWTGIRGEARVVAAVPACDPELHAWGDRGPAKLATQPDDYESTSGGNGFSDADYGTVDDEEIPF